MKDAVFCDLNIHALLMISIKTFFYCLTVFIYSSFTIAAEHVGDQSCKTCHLKEHQQWQGSHHDLAMQQANAQTVLGDFNQVKFTSQGMASTFFMRNGRFMVNTDSPDNSLQDYEISYTFGVYPLQQYMVKFPQGKIQVLDIAWDTRTKDLGGQRWFSLHPGEVIKADDVLHWTGPNLNWNFMCADCHSTHLKKNYDSVKKSYDTQWNAINVSCEACHGPASEHIAWTKLAEKSKGVQNKGLTIALSAATTHHWQVNTATRKPELLNARSVSNTEVEMCARCHSRRSQFDDDFIPGDNFRDHYLPALLTESLYYPDGKIKDEVYVYGSFIQSRMYQAGVSCSDCHNPHTLELKANGDLVCQQCHLATDYMHSKHHFHQDKSTGASCIACHMPSKTYMGVDERNDHSFRIPRPDLAAQLNMPDACTLCHTDKNSQWAADAMQRWYGKTPRGYQQFAKALLALQQQDEHALSLAYAVIINDVPSIAKATALGYLGRYPSRQTLMTSLQMLRSSQTDMRLQALQALQGFPLQHTVAQIFPLLKDPVKIVRLEAASILAAIPRGSLQKEQMNLMDKVIEEYRQSLLFSADRPESQLALARLYRLKGLLTKAETAFQQAIFLQKKYIPAYINYANFLQQQHKEPEAFAILQQGLTQIDDATLYHALGLWYVRNKDKEKGRSLLQKATAMEPENTRFLYVYAIAIGEIQTVKAIKILEASLEKHSGNIEVLMALAGYHTQLGDENSALKYRNKAESVMHIR